MMISTSEIRVSCIIEKKYTELAVRVLHDEFGLNKETSKSGKSRSKKPQALKMKKKEKHFN
jgi:hypothetical protein